MNWTEGLPPHIEGAEFDVRLKSGAERTVIRWPELDWSNLFFTDCKHPLQNGYCAYSEISAWRITAARIPNSPTAAPIPPQSD